MVNGLPPALATVNQGQSLVSVPEQQTPTIRLFPNPTTGRFSIISTGHPSGFLEVTVMDLTGKIICEKKCNGFSDCTFDFSNLPRGLYFVGIKTEKEFLVRKLGIIR
jgi:hypothetical protein